MILPKGFLKDPFRTHAAENERSDLRHETTGAQGLRLSGRSCFLGTFSLRRVKKPYGSKTNNRIPHKTIRGKPFSRRKCLLPQKTKDRICGTKPQGRRGFAFRGVSSFFNAPHIRSAKASFDAESVRMNLSPFFPTVQSGAKARARSLFWSGPEIGCQKSRRAYAAQPLSPYKKTWGG